MTWTFHVAYDRETPELVLTDRPLWALAAELVAVDTLMASPFAPLARLGTRVIDLAEKHGAGRTITRVPIDGITDHAIVCPDDDPDDGDCGHPTRREFDLVH